MAAIIGVRPDTLAELAAKGRVVRLAYGRYDCRASILAYCSHLRTVGAGRGGEAAMLDLTGERARLAKSQADAQEMKNATLRGELIPAADVTSAWRGIVTAARAQMLAVPSRFRARLPHLTATEIDILDREIRDALVVLSDGRA